MTLEQIQTKMEGFADKLGDVKVDIIKSVRKYKRHMYCCEDIPMVCGVDVKKGAKILHKLARNTKDKDSYYTAVIKSLNKVDVVDNRKVPMFYRLRLYADMAK